MNKYVLGIDTWEGSLDIDEDILKLAGVGFIIPRLNSIAGDLHKDDLFDTQWEQAANFVRWPYFVFDPYHTGRINAEWLLDNMPKNASAVSPDIEVKRPDSYSPVFYAAQVAEFYKMVSQYWKVIIYSGEWFKSFLSSWPKCDYWWARYPYTWHPNIGQPISWEELHSKARKVAWNPACSLGDCHVWQISGDRYKPPGCNNRAVDINLFNGDLSSLQAYIGSGGIKHSVLYYLVDWAKGHGYTGPEPEA